MAASRVNRPEYPALPVNRIIQSALPIADAAALVVTIGGVKAVVEFAGLVSNGLYQFNVVIPSVADGDQTLAATLGGVSTPPGSFLSVRTPR